MKNKVFYCVEHNNYTGDGYIRELAIKADDPRLEKQRAPGVYIWQDKTLGLSRVVYDSKRYAENVLLSVLND